MDKLNKYRELIRDILTEDAQYKPSHGEIEPFLFFDDEHDSYQLMYIGWDSDRRVHAVILHLRLHNNKIWIEEDNTEEGVATALLAAGIPKEDIVLAFHSPAKRRFTEFAVA
jgi:hypothetical protein